MSETVLWFRETIEAQSARSGSFIGRFAAF